MTNVSLRVLFFAFLKNICFIFFINLGQGHWVDMLITFGPFVLHLEA